MPTSKKMLDLVPPPMLNLPQPTEDALLTMRIMARVQPFLPYGSQIWQDVMKARGLDPRPRSMT